VGDCSAALACDPTYAKAYLRRGELRARGGDVARAKAGFKPNPNPNPAPYPNPNQNQNQNPNPIPEPEPEPDPNPNPT